MVFEEWDNTGDIFENNIVLCKTKELFINT